MTAITNFWNLDIPGKSTETLIVDQKSLGCDTILTIFNNSIVPNVPIYLNLMKKCGRTAFHHGTVQKQQAQDCLTV